MAYYLRASTKRVFRIARNSLVEFSGSSNYRSPEMSYEVNFRGLEPFFSPPLTKRFRYKRRSEQKIVHLSSDITFFSLCSQSN